MRETITTYLQAHIIGDHIPLTRAEFCRACGIAEEDLTIWILEGVIEPSGEKTGEHPRDWKFDSASLRRARLALRLTRDLEINLAGAALALDLLDQISELKAQITRNRKV